MKLVKLHNGGDNQTILVDLTNMVMGFKIYGNTKIEFHGLYREDVEIAESIEKFHKIAKDNGVNVIRLHESESNHTIVINVDYILYVQRVDGHTCLELRNSKYDVRVMETVEKIYEMIQNTCKHGSQTVEHVDKEER